MDVARFDPTCTNLIKAFKNNNSDSGNVYCWVCIIYLLLFFSENSIKFNLGWIFI